MDAFGHPIAFTFQAGRRPRGWMGPALTETFQTPALLAELGLGYVLDWCNDDQPYRLNVPGMLSVPYSSTSRAIQECG